MTMIEGQFGEHTVDCWRSHDECALRTAVSYLSARIAHDQARMKLYRNSLGGRVEDPVDVADAVAMARDLLADNTKLDWTRGATA